MKNITATIKKLIAEKGISIIDQEKRLNAILADLHPEEKLNRYLIELSLAPQVSHNKCKILLKTLEQLSIDNLILTNRCIEYGQKLAGADAECVLK